MAEAFLHIAAREAARAAGPLTDAELDMLAEELIDLPSVDLSLQAQLPKLLSPALAQLCEAMAEHEPADEIVLDEVLDELDTPLERARLARAVITARDAGRCGRLLAAVALIDLASGSRQLLCASVVEALAVRAGVARTPGGIILAA